MRDTIFADSGEEVLSKSKDYGIPEERFYYEGNRTGPFC